MTDVQDISHRVAAIRARLEAATPGPWRTVAIPEAESELAVAHDEEHVGPCICGQRVEHVDLFQEFVPLTPVEGQHDPSRGVNVFRADMAKPEQHNVACLVHVSESDPNVRFIAHAPEDVAYLLAQVERLEAKAANAQASVLAGIQSINALGLQVERLESSQEALRGAAERLLEAGPFGPSVLEHERCRALHDALAGAAGEESR